MRSDDATPMLALLILTSIVSLLLDRRVRRRSLGTRPVDPVGSGRRQARHGDMGDDKGIPRQVSVYIEFLRHLTTK